MYDLTRRCRIPRLSSMIALSMNSLLSQDQKRNGDSDGMVRSMRILASGLFIVFLVLWGWWWWSRFDIDLMWYTRTVYVLLFLMAWCVIMRMVERSVIYAAARNQSRAFGREVVRALHEATSSK